MNIVLTFLEENRERLNLARYGAHGPLTSVLLTPRFQASSHVVFMILDKRTGTPVLVAKMPRLAHATASIEHEAANLRMVQALQPAGFESVPQVVALETYCDRLLLVETALVGQLMDPAFVRSHREHCCCAVTDWLLQLQPSGMADERSAHGQRLQLLEQPLRYMMRRFPLRSEEAWLLEQTARLLEPLRGTKLPLPVEHGDMSHPNLFLMQNGSAGVVDWELAAPVGLPACDLYFFLTYVAFAQTGAAKNGAYLDAFESAFFGADAWAHPFVQQYAQALKISDETLSALFVVTWLRYVVGLLRRLDDANGVAEKVDDKTANWLRQNRYFALWNHSVRQLDRLRLAA